MNRQGVKRIVRKKEMKDIKKYYVMKSERFNGWYCGKCGKKLPMDRYNSVKHAACCWEGTDYETEFLEEGADRIYSLEALPGKIVLTVNLPLVKCIPGFTDRFEGTQWIRTFEAEYEAGCKEPRVTYDPAGTGLENVLSRIREGRYKRGRGSLDAEILRLVFPSVIAVDSMEMFDYIYRHKGFRADRKIPPLIEEKLLEKLPGDAEQPVPAAAGDDDEEQPIPVSVTSYRYKEETVILRIVVREEREQTVFLFSRGYAACSDLSRVKRLLRGNYILTDGSKNAIRSFDHAYPEYMLGRYTEKSGNILVPLIASDFHCGMELAAKAGAIGVAENCRYLKAFDRHPSEYGNLKKLFGIPPATLRALGRDLATTENIERMKEVFEYNPQLLCFDYFTPSMLEFLHRADITHSRHGNMIAVSRELSDKQFLKILRYLSGHPDEGHYYCDYLNASHILGEFAFGLTPDIPIREAHDRTVLRIQNNRNEFLRMGFENQVAGKRYLELTTCMTQEDEEKFEKDDFVVIAPGVPDDLFVESQNMHNCVRIYTDSVAAGHCKIYFLRKKDERDKSYGTIEVSGDGSRLIQAKAFANRKLPAYAQRFVRKWCIAKKIRIATSDINVL